MTRSVQPSPTPFNFAGFAGFQGFAYPNTTPVPDLLFDHIMQDLDEKELKVLLYIIRRTFGFKKQADNISLNQLVNGIITRDGRVLDRGTGLSKASVARALQSLKQKNLINAVQNRDPRKGNLPTTYSLKMVGDPSLSRETRGISPVKQALVSAVRHTTNRKTTPSQTAAVANDNNAAVLIAKGVGKNTAHKLVTKYPAARIRDNIDLLDHVQQTAPHTIRTNPAGWLIKAIEDNYAETGRHRGFQTQQQKASTAAVQKQRRQAQQKRIDAHQQHDRAVTQQQQRHRATQLETLRQQYHTQPTNTALWQRVLDDLQAEVSTHQFNLYLAHSALLSHDDGTVVIAVPNAVTQDWVAHRLAPIIKAVLTRQLQQQIVEIKPVLLATADNGS